MKNPHSPISDDLSRIGLPSLSVMEEKLLNIYWFKKELEEFLPQIATYATPKELTAITISQLAIMEKLLVQALQNISENGPEDMEN